MQEYTIETIGVEYTIPEFAPSPIWCPVSYSYLFENAQGDILVSLWNDQTRTFTFEYYGGAEPLNGDLLVEYVDYEITLLASTGYTRPIVQKVPLILRARNPCHENSDIDSS